MHRVRPSHMGMAVDTVEISEENTADMKREVFHGTH